MSAVPLSRLLTQSTPVARSLLSYGFISQLQNSGLFNIIYFSSSFFTRTVASLGLVSPGAASEGVTPIYVPSKNWRPFLVIAVCQFGSITLFSPQKLTTFFADRYHFYWFHSGVTPSGAILPPPLPLVTPLHEVYTVNIKSNPWRPIPAALHIRRIRRSVLFGFVTQPVAATDMGEGAQAPKSGQTPKSHWTFSGLAKSITDIATRGVLSRRESTTRNSSGDEIANVNFLYDDIVHALKMQ